MSMDDLPPIIRLSSTKGEGIPDEKVVDFLDEADDKRYLLGQALFKEEMSLIRESLSLHHLALSFAADNEAAWNEQDRVQTALMARVFNLLRAEAKLVLFGYYAATPPLHRTLYECISRVLLVYWYPEEATKFLKGKFIGQKDGDAKIAGKMEGDDVDTYAQLRKLYSFESKRVHPELKSLEFENAGTDEDIGSRAILGGVVTPDITPVALTDILQQCLFAVKTLGVIGLHKATDNWKDRYVALEGEALRRIERYRNEYGSIKEQDSGNADPTP